MDTPSLRRLTDIDIISPYLSVASYEKNKEQLFRKGWVSTVPKHTQKGMLPDMENRFPAQELPESLLPRDQHSQCFAFLIIVLQVREGAGDSTRWDQPSEWT